MSDVYSSRPVIQYRYLTLISMIYITIMVAGSVITYKMVSLAGFNILAGSFLTPTWFIIGDIITEIYGYKAYRRLIWQATLCNVLFAVICVAALHSPSPKEWTYLSHYSYVLGMVPRLIFGSLFGVLAGLFINSYLISKWKILVKGRHFWIRSLTSSITGEFIFTIATMAVAVYGMVSFKTFVTMVLVSCGIKLVSATIFIIPSILIVIFLKKHENVNVFDYGIDYNPFKLRQ